MNSRLVRGLDYYVRTTFEVVSSAVGSQSAVVAGGRYDGLVEALGGAAVPGVGFAIGVERIALALPADRFRTPFAPDAAIIALGAAAALERPVLSHVICATPVCAVEMFSPERGLKALLRRADKLGARYARDHRRKRNRARNRRSSGPQTQRPARSSRRLEVAAMIKDTANEPARRLTIP